MRVFKTPEMCESTPLNVVSFSVLFALHAGETIPTKQQYVDNNNVFGLLCLFNFHFEKENY